MPSASRTLVDWRLEQKKQDVMREIRKEWARIEDCVISAKKFLDWPADIWCVYLDRLDKLPSTHISSDYQFVLCFYSDRDSQAMVLVIVMNIVSCRGTA